MAGVIRHRNEVLARGFTQADNWVLFDKRISDGARTTYLRLRWYARQQCSCFPGQVTLAKAAGRSDRTIRMHLAELKAVGLITIEQRGHCKTNEYWIEDMNDVYGSESDKRVPSDEALEACWPVGACLKEDPPDEDEEPANLPVVQMTDAARAIVAGSERAKAERKRQVKKKVLRATKAKVVRKKPPPEPELSDEEREAVELGLEQARRREFVDPPPETLRPKDMERIWREDFTRKFHVMTSSWGAKEFKLLKKLVGDFGPALVMRAMKHVIEHWENYVDRFGLNGYPALAFLWGYRNTIFPEIQGGKAFDGGKRSAAAKIREAEYSEGEDDEDLETPGW